MSYIMHTDENRITFETLPIDALVQFWGELDVEGEKAGRDNYGRVRKVDISVEDTGKPGKMRITHTYTIIPVSYETGAYTGTTRPVQSDRIIRSL